VFVRVGSLGYATSIPKAILLYSAARCSPSGAGVATGQQRDGTLRELPALRVTKNSGRHLTVPNVIRAISGPDHWSRVSTGLYAQWN
jgi:hypothetical protein